MFNFTTKQKWVINGSLLGMTLLALIFNFVENSWWNKKNHQYDNLKNNFV